MVRVGFVGSKSFGLNFLENIPVKDLVGVVTIDDSKDPRSVLTKFKKYCEVEKIPCHIIKTTEEFEQTIQTLQPDICFMVCWYKIISDSMLEFVPKGWIGVHHSLLPKYRGGSPLVWQLINGEPTVGSSMFVLAHDMDAGPILHQVEVSSEGYISDVMERLETSMLRWFMLNYTRLIEGRVHAYPQREADATFVLQRHPRDGEINWNDNAETIYNFIRAQSHPYPGAFTKVNGGKVTVWRATLDSG